MNKFFRWKIWLFLAVAGIALSGCDNGSNTDNVVVGQSQAPGNVLVLLTDPDDGTTHPSVQRPLRFFGVNQANQVVYGPVERDFAAQQLLRDVPADTRGIVALAPDDPTIAGELEVQVLPGRTVYATDLRMLPNREGNAATAVLAQGATSKPPTVVGAGFIQNERSELGPEGSSPVMAGADAASITDDVEWPLRSNSWLSPILWADNNSSFYVGGNELTAWQKSIYPKPWSLHFNRETLIIDGVENRSQWGIQVGPEQVRANPGAQLPGSKGFGGEDNPNGPPLAEVQGTFTISPLTINPGFVPLSAKVNRIGDYDADLWFRAVDDPEFDSLGLDREAGLHIGLVRGNPFLYCTANALPKVEFAPHFAGAVENLEGTVDVEGVNIGYNVLTSTFPGYEATGGQLSFAFFYPTDTATYTATPDLEPHSIEFANPDEKNYFAICILPDASFADENTMAKLAAAAFWFPVDTKCTLTYDQVAQEVSAQYKIETESPLGLQNPTSINGLLPHHYQPSPVHNNDAILQSGPQPLRNGSGTEAEFLTVRGTLKLYESDSFTCVYPFPGILPYMPDLDGGDTQGRDKLAEWVDFFARRNGSGNPPYVNSNAGGGQGAYELGKFLGRNTVAAHSIREVFGASRQDLTDQIFGETRNAIEQFFQETPAYPAGLENKGQAAPYYLYYDPRLGAINQYPNGLGPADIFPQDTNIRPYDTYGAVTRNNDHHFHYGYYIFAAAQIGLQDSAWAAQWKDAVNQLIFDIANDPSVNPNPALAFPRMRYWDFYQNSCYAAAFTAPDQDGNNLESISEELNFWSGVILWGLATDQPLLTEHGIKHYTCAVHTSWSYPFDPAGNGVDLVNELNPGLALNWPGNGAARLFDAYTRWDTFFGIHPTYARAIVMLPMTGASFYHAMNTDYITQVMNDYDQNVQQNNIDPLNPDGNDVFDGQNQWINGPAHFYAHFAKYYAMADPDNAISRYWDVPSNFNAVGTPPDNLIVPADKFTDVGDSGVFTYHFIRYLQTHGTPDTWTAKATNTPFFMTFDNQGAGTRTYVGFNPTNSPLTINFSDGQSIPNVPAKALGSITVP